MNKQKEHFNIDKKFFICSYGGSGSKLLSGYLGHFGKTFHIHSRKPPNNLCLPNGEHFCLKKIIPNEDLKNCKFIFIYRDPIKSIHSRFTNPAHLKNIECDNKITIQEVIDKQNDLYGIGEFIDNYTTPFEKNYEIICIKYESLFNEIEKINEILEIPNVKELLPKKYEKTKEFPYYNQLLPIYQNIIQKINSFQSIFII